MELKQITSPAQIELLSIREAEKRGRDEEQKRIIALITAERDKAIAIHDNTTRLLATSIIAAIKGI